MLKVGVVISGSGWLLAALINGCLMGDIQAEIAVSISNEDNEVAIPKATKTGIRMLVIKHGDFPDRMLLLRYC